VRAIDSHADRPAGPERPDWLSYQATPELAWLAAWLVCVTLMLVFPGWQIVPLDVIWISLALLYGRRIWPSALMLVLIATAAATTVAVVGYDIFSRVRVIGASVDQIPLLATMVAVMAWQAHRWVVSDNRPSADAERLLRAQRQFLQDASHQLRTPITIALGHAELLAAELADQQQRDIGVVVGELERLRTLSDRLLLIAACEDPGFLALEPTDLDALAVSALRRWQPIAPRRWQLGTLDSVRALGDSQRLAMAVDALIENAVRHTRQGDVIELSVSAADRDGYASLVVEDSGDGIDDADLPHVFERFATMARHGSRGTGLGLALVEAVARGHGGAAKVQSTLGRGSRFEILLPAVGGSDPPEAPAVPEHAHLVPRREAS
jgi:signal transduction histidine kinase